MAEPGHDDGDDDGYEGSATLVAGPARVDVQVRLRGYFQPIDGRYHWYGRIEPNEDLAGVVRSGRARAVLTTPEGSAPCELSDPDPWQRYRVTGLSTPPFATQAAPAGKAPNETATQEPRGEISAATGQPAEITDRDGDSFSLFGGRVEGRQIELEPGRRVVQAWRFGAAHPSPWEPGVYSTVRFTLEPAGAGTRFVIDHTGIPAEWVEHLSSGYPTFYQDPITNFFANG